MRVLDPGRAAPACQRLRLSTPEGMRTLFDALDAVVADDRSYVLVASGGLYCSHALLRASVEERAPAAPSADVADFRPGCVGLSTP